jgi:uncharacterized protein (TIGR02466 family)
MTPSAMMAAPLGQGVHDLACRRLDLFPVQVFRWQWPEADARKAELVEAIRQRRTSHPGVVKSNRLGWHSSPDLPAWPNEAIQELVRWSVRCTEATTLDLPGNAEAAPLPPWRVSAWANVNPPCGAHNISHTHAQRNWHWSACYYVDLAAIGSSPELGGALVLEDRGSGLECSATGGGHRMHRITPVEGELIIFPAWLYHRVEEHYGSGDRITIAFNLHNRALERARLWEHRPRFWWRRWPNLMRRIATARGTPDLSFDAMPSGWDVQA